MRFIAYMLAIWGCMVFSAFSQKTSYKFDHLSTKEGLSQSSVFAIVQDSKGFMWFGTQNGLNMYDGTKFTVFKHNPEDSTSISAHWIFTMTLDTIEGEEYIWLGTNGGGLNRFNISTHVSTNFKYSKDSEKALSSDFVNVVMTDNDGALWIGTNNGLNKYDPASESFVHYLYNSASHKNFKYVIRAIIDDGQGNLLIGTDSNGLAVLNKKSNKITFIAADAENPKALSDNHIRSLYLDSRGLIWVGTYFGGLNIFNPKSGDFTLFEPPGLNSPKSENVRVINIMEDRDLIMWFGMFKGVMKYDPREGDLQYFYHDPLNPNSISDNDIYEIFQDSSGLIWFGTHGGGISKLNKMNKTFYNYGYLAGSDNNLSSNSITAICTGRKENGNENVVWVGTTSGLNKVCRKTGNVLWYSHEPGNKNSISDNDVFALDESETGHLWIGTYGGGLDCLNLKNGRIKHFKNDPNAPYQSLLSDDIRTIKYERYEGRPVLWIGYYYSGLSSFDINKKKFTHYIHNLNFESGNSEPGELRIRAICFDINDQDILWVGTFGGGLKRINKKSGEIINYKFSLKDSSGISSNFIRSLYIAPQDPSVLWVGTENGLNAFLINENKFIRYTVSDGLPDEVIYAIAGDKKGNIWFSTNNGLSRFDLKNKVIKNYDANDGLQANEFNQGAVAVANGELFFGGINGMNSFVPEEIKDNPHIPPVVLTGLKLYDKEMKFTTSISDLKEINLLWNQNFITIEFSALDYTEPGKNRYRYKLDGVDKDWIDCGNRNSANYTNLSSGHYVFRVIGSNNDNVWNNEGTSIAINIAPPFWKTKIAYGIYAFLVISLFVIIILVITNLQNMAIKRKNTLINKLKQIDKMKDEFLTITTHELKTPLNGIVGIAESLINGASGELSEETKANLNMLVASGKRLSNLINDILDFAKLKNSEIILQKKAVDIRQTIDVVLFIIQPAINNKGLNIELSYPKEQLLVNADENRLQQIIYNLMDNAIKFTPKGTIYITVEHKNKEVNISIKDTGIGIPADKLHSIFKSYEQVDPSISRKYGGTGIGLSITKKLIELHGSRITVNSIEGNGSEFSFTLPLISDKVSKKIYTPSHNFFFPPKPVSELLKTHKIDGNSKRILLVDDDPVNLQVLINHLHIIGYDVIPVLTGKAALKILADSPKPDLILLDIMMPEISGFDVCKEIRQKYSANELPIIILTAKNSIQDVVEGLKCGANDYLTKPFSGEELLARVKNQIHLVKLHSLELEYRKQLEEEVESRTAELSEKMEQLQKALSEIKTLNGLLPICSSCKKIRNDDGYWQQIEIYVKEHSDADFSHGLCPDCMRKLYPDVILDDGEDDKDG